MSRKKPSAGSQRVVISLVYVFLGIGSVLSAFEMLKGLLAGTFPGLAPMLTVLAGVLMFLAGILGLFRLQKTARVWLGVLVFLVALVHLVFAVLSLDFSDIGMALMQAAIAWLYIGCN